MPQATSRPIQNFLPGISWLLDPVMRLVAHLPIKFIVVAPLISPNDSSRWHGIGSASRFLFHFSEFLLIISPSRAHKRGASRSSRVSGAGCGGRDHIVRRAMGSRTAKSCGPDSPMLESSLSMMIDRRWWLTSPVHQGEREAAVKTIAQGNAGCFGCPVVACVRKVHFLCTQGSRVQPASGIPCALLLIEDAICCKPWTLSRRGNAESCLSGCLTV